MPCTCSSSLIGVMMMESEGKMTKEEAIEELKDNIKLYTPLYGDVDRDTPDGRLITALETAIRTLENHDIFMKRAYSQGKQDALSQEPCEDAVSRQAVLSAIADYVAEGWAESPSDINGISALVNDLPSVNPQETVTEFADRCRECGKMRKGHWIYDKTIENWRCSKCNETPKTMGYVGTADFMAEHFKFCNHCGAYMAESEGI